MNRILSFFEATLAIVTMKGFPDNSLFNFSRKTIKTSKQIQLGGVLERKRKYSIVV